MGYNKVVIGPTTKLDLSSDTVTADDVLVGKTFHDSNGDTQEGVLNLESTWTAILKIKTINPKLFNQPITITKIRDWEATMNMSTANKNLYNQEIEVDKQ